MGRSGAPYLSEGGGTREMAARLGLLLLAVVACYAIAEEVTTLAEAEPVRDDLNPEEEKKTEGIDSVKSMKKYIFDTEAKMVKSEMAKEDSGDGEEIAIGATLKEMEAEHAVQDEMQMEIPMDCHVGEWGKFGKCSALCDGGKMERKRSVVKQPANGGKPCPELSNEVECNMDSCASEAYQRRATRRKLTAEEKRKESLQNAIKISHAMKSRSTYQMMRRTREVMRKLVHTQVAEVQLPGEEGERTDEQQVRKTLQEAMAQNAVSNAMKTFQNTQVQSMEASESEKKKEFDKETEPPLGKPPSKK